MNNEEYLKGYNTAKNSYLKKMTKQKHEYEERIRNINICAVYPYNLLMNILEANEISETDDVMYYSPRLVKEQILKLSEIEQQVIEMRYRYNFTLEEIGRKLGVTRERIRQVEAKVIRKLRQPTSFYQMRVIPYKKYVDLLTEKAEIENENHELRELLHMPVEEVKKENEKAIPIENFDFSVRTYNCLKRANFNTYEDVKELYEKEGKNGFYKIRNLGGKGISEIFEKVLKIDWVNMNNGRKEYSVSELLEGE